MKKISILGVCLLTGLAAMAQESLVKDVEHTLKGSNPDYQKALNDVQPALTNSETANTMMPWYLAGKAGVGLYENLYMMESLGQALSPDQKKMAGHALVDGYNYYFKALHLDSLPDEKGKIKPKKSKEILKTLANNYHQLRNAGIFLFDNQDYDGAYDAWELYCTLPQNPVLGKSAPVADPDTIIGQIRFYQGVAMLTHDKNDRALKSIQEAIKDGFQTIDVYRYGVESARRLDDSVAMLDIAKAGYEKFGTEDVIFIGQIINHYIADPNFPACFDLVNEAIKASTDNKMLSQFYDIRGYIYEQDNKIDEAVADFTKATELDDSNAKAFFDLGRMINNTVAAQLQDTSDNNVPEEQAKELLKAADLFERAYQLDEANYPMIPGILYRLYYRLGEKYVDQSNQWKALGN